jgi:hypothetical protein
MICRVDETARAYSRMAADPYTSRPVDNRTDVDANIVVQDDAFRMSETTSGLNAYSLTIPKKKIRVVLLSL